MSKNSGAPARPGARAGSIEFTLTMPLERLGYRRQVNCKTREGGRHPDRDAQFEHINTQVAAFQAAWSRVERVIARVEAGAEGPDTRFVVTNLNKRNARALYEDVYCRRGQAENHIKSWKTHLAADRTSCTKATANQLRLFLHAGAYWLTWGLRTSMPKRSMWRVAQFDTLRLRLIKIAARVVEMKTMIRVHLPTSCPGQEILRFALGRIPRLVT